MINVIYARAPGTRVYEWVMGWLIAFYGMSGTYGKVITHTS